MTWADLLGPLLGGAVGSLIALLGGWLREKQQTRRYELHLAADAEYRRQLIEAPESVRDELERTPPSKPPVVGPLAALVALSLGAGVSAGSVAPHAVAAIRADDTAAKCTPQNCPGGRCVSGKCQKMAETEEPGPSSDVAPSLLVTQDPADLSLNEPPI